MLGGVRKSWIVLFGLSLAVTACGTSTVSPSAGSPGASQGSGASAPSSAGPASAEPWADTVSIRLGADWSGVLDPFGELGGDSGKAQILMALYDRLVGFNAKGELTSYVADSWTQETPTSVKFQLKSGITCGDGTALTATMVADAIRQFFEVSAAGRIVPNFGSGPYTVTADDAANSVTVEVGAPFGTMVEGFGNSNNGSTAYIVCSAGLTATEDQRNTQSFGTGPYAIKEIIPGDRITLSLRPEWTWGPEGTTSADLPQTLEFRVVENSTTAANLLLGGDLTVSYLQGDDVRRLEADSSVAETTVSSYVPEMLLLNHDAARPTSADAVRQAILTAVDPAGYNQAANDGRGRVSPTIMLPEVPCYDPATETMAPVPNVDAAKAVLEGAGYTFDGQFFTDGGQPLTLRLLTFPELAGGPEYLYSQLTAAGFKVELENIDRASYVPKFRGGDFDVSIVTNASAIPVPNSIQYLYGRLQPDGINFIRRVDADFDALVNDALGATGDQRCQLWSEIQKQLITTHAILPLAALEFSFFHRPNVSLIAATTRVEVWSLRRQ